MALIRSAQLRKRGAISGHVGHVDVQRRQVLRCGADRVQGHDNVPRRLLELRDDPGGQAAVRTVTRLAAEVHQASRCRDDRVGEPDGWEQTLGVDDAVRSVHRAHRPRQRGSRLPVNAA
jgi:hypothetical protein